MARSKNRVLGIEDTDGKYIKVQLQLENGEVVIGGYELVVWCQPTTEIRDDINRRVSGPPVAICRTVNFSTNACAEGSKTNMKRLRAAIPICMDYCRIQSR